MDEAFRDMEPKIAIQISSGRESIYSFSKIMEMFRIKFILYNVLSMQLCFLKITSWPPP